MNWSAARASMRASGDGKWRESGPARASSRARGGVRVMTVVRQRQPGPGTVPVVLVFHGSMQPSASPTDARWIFVARRREDLACRGAEAVGLPYGREGPADLGELVGPPPALLV